MSTNVIKITENLIPIIQKDYDGLKFTPISKVCDFCNRDLPLSHESLQCSECPIIYDKCVECTKNNDQMICHKDHSVDNSRPSREEVDAILNRNKDIILW
jgi:hypothetical protein